MGVAENFRAFRDEYLISQTLMSSISARYKRITRQLNTDFWNTDSEVSHSLYIGSYGRDTAAKGVSEAYRSALLTISRRPDALPVFWVPFVLWQNL